MKSKSRTKIILLFVFSIISIWSISLFMGAQNSSNTYSETILLENLHTSRVVPHNNILWVENPTFNNTADPWYPTIVGDSADVTTSTSQNQANIELVGETYEKEVLLNNETWTNWEAFNKTDLVIVPQDTGNPSTMCYGINASGAWCWHLWYEGDLDGQPKNTPRMHWRTNVSLPVDMSDYLISSVDFDSLIYGRVNDNIDTPDDTIARDSVAINQWEVYDYAQFYVEISTLDIDVLNTYRIAFNQTRLLGNEDLSLYEIEDYIGAYEEQAIIDALNSVLAVDPGHDDFTIILGIYMYCEDNLSGVDRDTWEDMKFKNLNLTFTYTKKIDEFTTVSWNQDLKAVNGTGVRITDSNLKFKFKIDQNWTTASQNSLIRIFVNDRKFEQTISLIDYEYSTSFQEANEEGYDITSKLVPYENFTLSIQVYLADEFGLTDNISISITDIYLLISYTETLPDDPITRLVNEPWFFATLLVLVSLITAVISGYLIAYQRVLKYPRPVRKVRKYSKTLKSRNDPDVPIMPQDVAFKKSYAKETANASKLLHLRTFTVRPPKLKQKLTRAKEPEKVVDEAADSNELIAESLDKKEELDKLIDETKE